MKDIIKQLKKTAFETILVQLSFLKENSEQNYELVIYEVERLKRLES